MTRLPKHVRRYGGGRFRAVVARGDGTRRHGPLGPTPEEAAADAIEEGVSAATVWGKEVQVLQRIGRAAIEGSTD